jgi:hypothetical protein
MADRVDREIRNGTLDELSNSRRPKRPSEIAVIDEETRKKFFSLLVKGGQVFSAKKENPGSDIRNYEII